MDRKKTALLSAFDKTGVFEFAQALVALGWDILASGGTAKHLKEKGIEVRDVAEIVGPPILGHRVVTLSREIHAGLLAQETQEDLAELARIGVPFIDLVYVDLYPLELEIAKPDRTVESVIEKTDIGGPTMLRSAAKGRRIVLSQRHHFAFALSFIKGELSMKKEMFLATLVRAAEKRVADYCRASENFHAQFAAHGNWWGGSEE